MKKKKEHHQTKTANIQIDKHSKPKHSVTKLSLAHPQTEWEEAKYSVRARARTHTHTHKFWF